ncbi:regulatory protein UhpC [Actinobacillus equuli]|nr:regulatory protein UhpC [Actinobacillus equuli]
MGVLNEYFKEAPDLPVTKTKEEIDKTYRYWRIQLMLVSYVGYAVFILPVKVLIL